MLRSIEFPVDPRWIKNPKNSSPNASKGARQGAAAITRLCIVTIGLVLNAHFKAPTAFYTAPDGHMRPNRWTVTLTRMSMGVVDPITGGATMAAVQDAIALWCGVKDERDPVWQWVEPIRQEKRGRGFFGVRIVIEDLAPGDQPPVTLKTIEPFIWRAKQRIKEAKMYKDGVKKSGRVLTYQPEAGAREASSAARSKAEQSFAKLTGGVCKGCMGSGRVADNEGGARAHLACAGTGRIAGKPTAIDLRDAAERVLTPKLRHTDCGAKYGDVCRCGIGPDGKEDPHALDRPCPSRDPGEERPARDIVDGRHCCGVAIHEPCKRGGDHEVFVNGVHYQRAKAAGVRVGDTVKLDVTPWLKAPTNGRRRLVPPAQERPPVPPAVVRLPYQQEPCGLCSGVWAEKCPECKGGVIRPQPGHGGEHAPMTLTYRVPAEHRARFGDRVTLTRRRTTLPKLGDVWLYE